MAKTKRSDASIVKKLNSLVMALEDFKYIPSRNRKTDIIGTACQYSSHPKLKREDFTDILDMKISDIIKQQEEEHKNKLKK